MKIDRRQFLLGGSCGIGSSVLGLNWFDQIARAEVRGEELAGTRQYDAAMMVYYQGGPSQADSFDPKPGTSGSRYSAVRVPGMLDIYGEPVFVSDLIRSLSSIIGPERKQGLGKIEMGLIRSMHHGIPVHQFAQKFTTGFWQR